MPAFTILSQDCSNIVKIQKYRVYPKYSDLHAWAISVDHSKMQHLIRIFTISLSSSTSLEHEQKAKWTFLILRASIERAEDSAYSVKHCQIENPCSDCAGAYIILIIHSLHMPGGPIYGRFILLLLKLPLLLLIIIMKTARI